MYEKSKDERPESISKPNEPEKENKNISHKFDDGAIYALVLLQREGRLIDFLKESIDSYTDAQIGSAVRQIHKNCNKVMNDYFHVTPVIDHSEGEEVPLEEKIDPTVIRLTGKIPSSRPEKGLLRHKGWKISNLKLPVRNETVNSRIIQQAEVEILPK